MSEDAIDDGIREMRSAIAETRTALELLNKALDCLLIEQADRASAADSPAARSRTHLRVVN